MNQKVFFVFFIVATIFRHATSSSNNLLTENSSSNTPMESCDDCIIRAKKFYFRTVSDPEEFCVTNHLCVKDEDTNSVPTSLQSGGGPSLLTSTEPIDPQDSNINHSKSHNPITISAAEAPTMNPTAKTPIPGNPSRKPTDVENSIPNDATDSQLTLDESLSNDLTNNDTFRSFMSSIYLKNLTGAMDQEVSEIFSIIALDFLRDNSVSDGISEEIDFILVEVTAEGPEFGNSTKEEMHIDGMHVFFETVVDLEDNNEIDLPRLIESIFRNNKNDLFFRLAEADDFFIPLYGKMPSIHEVEESQSGFMRTSWVASSLAAVACSVLLSAILLVKKRTGPRRDYKDPSKQDTFPLYTLEQTCSECSTPTNKPGDGERQIGTVTNSYDSVVSNMEYESFCNEYDGSHSNLTDLMKKQNILMDLEGDTLVGLELLRSETNNSSSNSARDVGNHEKNNYEVQKRRFEIKGETDEESIGSRAGYKARMRKRQIEMDLRKKSMEGTSMGAILIATSSLKSDEEIGEHRSKIEAVEKQNSIKLEVHTGQDENLSAGPEQKRSFMNQISTIFRPDSKKQQIRRLEPIGINQEDGSVLSFLNTPQNTGNKINSFRDETETDKYLSVNTHILPKSILKVDKCESPDSPAAYTNFSRKNIRNHGYRANTHIVSSPTSKAVKRSRMTTPEGYYHY